MTWTRLPCLPESGHREVKKHEEDLKLANTHCHTALLQFQGKFVNYTQQHSEDDDGLNQTRMMNYTKANL
jgi:hypothetical protein